MEYDLQQTCCLAEELARENGAVLYAASLHPFAQMDDQQLSANQRYQRLIEELQLVGRQFISQGFHVHIGMEDAQSAIRIWNRIQQYLPLFLAISASSPYFQGIDTGFKSYRTKLFEMLPLAGLYGWFKDWNSLVTEVELLRKYGIIGGLRDLWWDARLNPAFGTLEIRICDLPGRFRDILALAAAMQCLVAYLAENDLGDEVPDNLVLQANKWQAARHGLQGLFIDPSGLIGKGRVVLQQAWKELLKCLIPFSVRLGCEHYLQEIEELLRRDSVAVLQRSVYDKENDFKKVIRALQEEFWK